MMLPGFITALSVKRPESSIDYHYSQQRTEDTKSSFISLSMGSQFRPKTPRCFTECWSMDLMHKCCCSGKAPYCNIDIMRGDCFCSDKFLQW